jgi:hypothetical protein
MCMMTDRLHIEQYGRDGESRVNTCAPKCERTRALPNFGENGVGVQILNTYIYTPTNIYAYIIIIIIKQFFKWPKLIKTAMGPLHYGKRHIKISMP